MNNLLINAALLYIEKMNIEELAYLLEYVIEEINRRKEPPDE